MRSVGQGKGVVFAEVPISFGLTSGLNPIICVRLWFLYSGFLCVSASLRLKGLFSSRLTI